MRKIAALLLLAALPVLADVPPGREVFQDGAKGYWFYREPPKPEPTPEQPTSTPVPGPNQERPKPSCAKAETWTPSCGFVDPGMDFSFQEKQRDALMQRMTLAPDDSSVVEAFQRYNKWVVGQSIKAAQMWQWNLTQRPDLDPGVQAPISSFALGLVANMNDASSKSVWKYIADSGGFLVAFTRSDCVYCSHMLPSLLRVQKTTGIPLHIAPIDGQCYKEVDPQRCLPAKTAFEAARVLQVSLVPALFLYVPENTWIRVATGMSTDTTIQSRISNFFAAYRTGLAKGIVGSGSTPGVSFDSHTLGLTPGSAGATPVPTEAELRGLLKGSYTHK
jgi:conjugal transfer pilus assembly protein TraF